MDTFCSLLLAFTMAMLAGFGAIISKPKMVAYRLLVGKMLVSGLAGLSAFTLYVVKFEVKLENHWQVMWVAVAAGYAGPQAMHILYKKIGLLDDNEK
jgi:hypothetical protein